MATRTILVFDDDEEVSIIIKLILQDSGWEVIRHNNCNDVVKKVANVNPSIIIMDHWIPIDGGMVATRQLKASAEYNHIPVIYFSAHNEIAKFTQESGANAYIAKPFDINEFEILINQYALG